MATFEEYKEALRNPTRQQIYKIEWMDKDENIIDETITEFIDGSISIQLQNGVRRSCNVTFENYDGTFTPSSNGLVYISKKMKIYSGLVINNENVFPPESVQGVFNLGNPVLRHDSSSNTVSIEGYDNFALLNGTLGGAVVAPVYKIGVDSVVNNAVQAVLDDGNIVQPALIYENDYVLYYSLVKEAGGTLGEVLTDIAYMVSWDIFFDTHGRPIFRPAADSAINADNASPVWEFNVNEVSYMGAEHNYNYADVRNHVIVYGENVNGDLAVGEAEDTNIFSPTSISRIGRRTITINDNMIIDDATATERAEYELRQAIQAYEFVNINTYNLDFLKEGEIILIKDDNADLDVDRYLVKQINRSLSPGSGMTIQAWKVRSIT